MNALHRWAADWNIPRAALMDLQLRLMPPTVKTDEAVRPEHTVTTHVLRSATLAGVWLTRNNVGAGKVSGRFMRWGLCNESAAVNDVIKSADLIGWRKVLIGPHHVGRQIAQFASVEVKASDWKPSDNEHDVAQARWRDWVLASGGFATITPRVPNWNTP